MKPVDVIGADAIAALRAAGWIVVRHDAIRLAQAHGREEVKTSIGIGASSSPGMLLEES